MEHDSNGAPWPSEADVDEVLAEFGGDVRATVRALLADIATLAADYGRDVSWGYVRRGDPDRDVARGPGTGWKIVFRRG